MSGFSDLLNVEFQDATSYVTTNTSDVLGIVMPYHWGPFNTLTVLDRQGFNEMFPESLPYGKQLPSDNSYFAFAQVKRFFQSGGSSVEIYRPLLGNKYVGIEADTTGWVVCTKYPGSLPLSLCPTNTTKCTVSYNDSTIKVTATVGDDEVVLESYTGQFNDPTAVEDGISTYLPNLVSTSQIITVLKKDDISSCFTTNSNLFVDLDKSDNLETDLKSALSNFNDLDTSVSTLLTSPVPNSNLDSDLISIADTRMNCTAVVGYPTTNTFDKSSISASLTIAKSLTTKMFSCFVACREYVQIFGNTILSNGLGLFCGKTANIASSVRLNQLASAKSYGFCSASLAATLKFSDVLSLHESGCISIYQSSTGPQIFGVRSLYKNQSSYFGKFNVSRVLASILKQVFPVCLNAVHTDAASNPITRASLNTQLSSIIDEFVANQNLKSSSYVDMSDELNTDVLTKGGTILNILLSLNFIGLVEKINIKVVATDSSVTAEIV